MNRRNFLKSSSLAAGSALIGPAAHAETSLHATLRRYALIANDAIQFELTGPAYLIGDNPFSLVGGTGAFWIRAQQRPGTIILKAKHPRLGMRQFMLTLRSATPELV